MREVDIDYPDEVVHWMDTYPEAERRRRPAGDCPHVCWHQIKGLAALGPDRARYQLMVCQDGDGCAGNCRAWINADPTIPELRRMQWRVLGASVPDSTTCPETGRVQ